jgi:hypothetical protein
MCLIVKLQSTENGPSVSDNMMRSWNMESEVLCEHVINFGLWSVWLWLGVKQPQTRCWQLVQTVYCQVPPRESSFEANCSSWKLKKQLVLQFQKYLVKL